MDKKMTHFTFKILYKSSSDSQFKEFIKYKTLEECINYLEKVNPTLRPAEIVRGQQCLRAYDYGIIDYQHIDMIEQENKALKKKLEKLL